MTQAQIDHLAAIVTGDSANAANSPYNWEKIKTFLISTSPYVLFQSFGEVYPNRAPAGHQPHDYDGCGVSILIHAIVQYGLTIGELVNGATLERIGNAVTTYPYTRGTGTRNEQLPAATP